MLTLFFVLCAAFATAGDQAVERQHVLSITAPDIDGGVLSEITWDNGALLLQGVVANPDGSLSGRYVVIPAKGTGNPGGRVPPALAPSRSRSIPRCRCTASPASRTG